ncbi:putative cytochrome p450 [Xylariaceae sp. FL1651]|nr:putative cytochrome p450 [Xylariaceae sp. FL1651]
MLVDFSLEDTVALTRHLLLAAEDHATSHSILRGLLCVVIVLAWTAWRCWKFTVYPWLHPDEPKELPYFVPILAHGASFFKDSNGLLERARRYFASTGTTPFALTAFGHTFYVVTNPKDSAAVYRNTESLSFDEFVQALMRFNGNDEWTIKNVHQPLPATTKAGFANPEGLGMINLTQRMHMHQLHPGEKMAVFQLQIRDWLNRKLTLDVLASTDSTYTGQSSVDSVELPLYQWTSDWFVRLGQHLYFGDVLERVDPQYTDNFVVFDEVIWKMLYQYPSLLCRDMMVPRDRMIASMRAYFQLHPDERRGQAAWLINTLEDEFRGIGVDDNNLAILFFHLYFAINTNARKTSFWVLTHMMRNPSYIAAFRSETAPAFDGDDLVDMAYIQDADKCPTVDAIWLETLRVAGWAASVRLVARDVVIGGKVLRAGNRIMVPHRLLHFDSAFAGDEPTAWRPGRWLDSDAGRKMHKSPSWHPFGGGRTVCSGRFLAKSMVMAFVSTILRRFDIEAVGNPPMPQPDVGKPVLGIISVMEGQDYRVKVTRRKEASA